MKKLLAVLVSLTMIFSLAAVVYAAPAGQEVKVTFSTGETATAVVGEPFEFFFQCDAPGDMGAPAEGEEGAGITVSSGKVAYSNVGLGGPYSYPTSELVTVTDFDGDFDAEFCAVHGGQFFGTENCVLPCFCNDYHNVLRDVYWLQH